MGTLLDRRRVMGKMFVPEYLEFEDPRMWELITYNYGDIVDMRGMEIASGELVGDGNTQAISDYVFARGISIGAHNDSRGKQIAAKSARTVDYRIEIEVTSGYGSGVPWILDSTTMGTANTVIFGILETCGYSDVNPPAAQTFASIVSDGDTGWGSQTTLVSMGSNKWYADFTSTTFTNYMRVAIRAASGVAIKWSLTPKSTSTNACWQPIGITIEQCGAVTSFGNSNSSIQRFRNNWLLTKFNEFRYFTKITNLWGNHNSGRYCNFNGCNHLTEITLPESLITLGDHCFDGTPLTSLDFKNVKTIEMRAFQVCTLANYVLNEGFESVIEGYNFSENLRYIDFPSTTIKIESTTFWTDSQSRGVVVIRALTPPTSGKYNTRIKRLYVPADSLEAYKTHQFWSQVASKTYQIEGTWYETHRSLDPNEP